LLELMPPLSSLCPPATGIDKRGIPPLLSRSCSRVCESGKRMR
jgi:hypothetical protein